MAVTRFQSKVLKLIARSRITAGETYVAGGLALNHQLRRPRVSEDIDVFNNGYDALVSASDNDRKVLTEAGYDVVLKRERDYIVEVTVAKDGEATDIQWVQDSAYRFFPLVVDELLGLMLHPFDLATNKLLPSEEVGKVVMTREGGLFRGTDGEFKAALAAGDVVFHEDVIGGAWPAIVEAG